MNEKERIAKRVAKELKPGNIVNLGIGLPTLVSNFVSKDAEIFFQGENGILGIASEIPEEISNPNLINAGGKYVDIIPGAMIFDSAFSFALIRGGHIDVTVLGAFQVDQEGHLANWMVPGKVIAGMGGAMDLVTGAKKVIIAMTHTSKGTPKIIKKCSLPLTSIRRVDLIVTEFSVIEPTDNGLLLKEISPDITLEELKEITEAELIVPDDLKLMEF
ncbi:3-oxoacid CoA-transferase, B subunit [Petrotoga mobilis SJ95]|jgi:acetate CoA/acetoacetate CoA-transferase beta subunit|uniref:3-oxoacid CoA-transferase, B subunit n=1 Tax=Petrotoga mobilis (strain DSM 10674 / SJ95) TaxID=403833 RepID=A9BG39_PETMO|nr:MULTISPECIES: 3-oxoacid CoA-transferase subunit B [Petrotoga]ABX31795.1 3-oxoacid CoA-transferase, B subunit [Petrotoga mobilis SJ95]RLL82845.1 acetate CoA-transferase [Petrotoga sp. Shatin.DS.tank11.9.2.9.3]RLL89358.1 acetate CoA-transferase [Petrotoga sp. HKA.pet.4.5]